MHNSQVVLRDASQHVASRRAASLFVIDENAIMERESGTQAAGEILWCMHIAHCTLN